MSSIRPISKDDLPALKKVLDSIDLFPSEMLDDMISDFFNNPDSEDIWFSAILDNKPISIGYCTPEMLTNGTYNLLAIGVLKDQQGNGIGRKMMDYLEEHLRKINARILIVETSGSEEMKPTRDFYIKCGYTLEATLRDFWDDADDKVVYWKRM